MEDKKSWAAKFNEIIGVEKIKALKDAYTKFMDATPPVVPPANPAPAPAPVKLESVAKTKDGKTLSIAGEVPAVGVAVMDTTTGEPIVLADGEYELEDGTKMTIKAGLIETYTPVEVVPPVDMTAAVTAMKAEFSAQKVEFEKTFTAQFASLQKEQTDIKSTVSDLVKLNAQVMDIFVKMSETAVEEQGKKPYKAELSKEEYNNLTNAEKVKYNRGKL